MLYRRTCVLLEDSRESGVTTSLGAERLTHFLCVHGLDEGIDEEDSPSRGQCKMMSLRVN